MTTEPAGHPPPRDQAGQHLAAIAAALASRGISTQLDCPAGTPVLTAVTRPATPAAATVTIHPDPWAAPALNCTCIWDPAPGTAPETVAATAAGILAAAGRPADSAAPDDAARLARFLHRHPGWSAFWDKAYGVWRAAEDDPSSAWYTESPDLAAVISYITAHS
jgi:hypothetical protein